MREIERLKEEILKDYPRLTEESIFSFNCHHGLSCFNDCCGDVNIFLTPYDIIRLKNNLGMSSTEFLDKYTISPFDQNLKYPIVLLKMQENDRKSCHFVGPDGCAVYNDRPWSCRMYPLGMASPGEDARDIDGDFYFLLKESVCKGFEEDRPLSVREWIKDQGIEDYNEMGKYFKDLTTHHFFQGDQQLKPKKIEMFYMVCYDIDKFRSFIFNSSFFDKFEVDETIRAQIHDDDVALLKFGYQWLRFALFGEATMKIKNDVKSAREAELAAKIAEQQKES
jgi:hypothetical protein